MGIKEMDEMADAYEELGGLSSYSGVKKNARKIQQPVRNPVDKPVDKAVDNRGIYEVMKTQRWIAEHSAPVVLSEERRAAISERLRATRAKVMRAKP